MAHSRREFLKSVVGTSTVLSLAPALPTFLSRSALAAPQERDTNDTVLVVLQLSGGNDGLNTVVPYDDDVYGRNRRTLRITESQVHKIGSSMGFHPEMKALWKLYQEGQLSILQGVGYPNSNRNHDTALRDWHTASPGDAACQTGWIGRAVDSVDRPDQADVPGVFVGPIARPFGLNAEKAVVPAIRNLEQLTLRTAPGSTGSASKKVLDAIQEPSASGNPLVDYVRGSTLAAHASSRQVQDVLRDADRVGEYPPFGLADRLKMVAQLVRAKLGIRIFFVELGGGGIGGFDNHANQRDNHAALLRQLSESVAAFVRDVTQAGMLDRVALITFSEFGRMVTENGRRGTNHGAAAPMFLAGGAVRGGLVGEHPSLTDLDQDAQKPHTDFRRVYATMLESWLGYDSEAVLGQEYKPLDVFV